MGIIGSDEKQTWWHICCINNQPGWVSDSVVTVQGDRQAVPVSPPLIPDDLHATWALHWQCNAAGCPSQCLGQSTAQAVSERDIRWLEVKRDATWAEDCGQPEDWTTLVDRYTGQEQQAPNGPLFAVWPEPIRGRKTAA